MIYRLDQLRFTALALCLLFATQTHAGTPYRVGSIRAALFSNGNDRNIGWHITSSPHYTRKADTKSEKANPNDANTGNWGYDRRFWRDIGPALKTSWSDLGHIYTSPARLNKKAPCGSAALLESGR